MPHYVTNDISRTVKGMKLQFKIKAPVSAKVVDIIHAVDSIFESYSKKIEDDPEQFGLFEDPDVPGEPE